MSGMQVPTTNDWKYPVLIDALSDRLRENMHTKMHFEISTFVVGRGVNFKRAKIAQQPLLYFVADFETPFCRK